MNLNPLSHLFNRDEERPFTEEELDQQDADAKKARIKNHRDNVRNGPVKTSYVSAGQQRRAAARGKKAFERKLNKRQRRSFHEKQASAAVLRGNLVILGQVECRNESVVFTETQRRDAAVWVARKFGERDDAGDLVESDDLFANSLKAARDKFLEVYGIKADA